MSDNSSSSSSSGIGLGGLIFIVFLVMKLTEKLSFWGDNFPRFLKSTDAWWDGWFMVFLPLWGGLVIAVVIVIICIGIAYLVNHKNFQYVFAFCVNILINKKQLMRITIRYLAFLHASYKRIKTVYYEVCL